MFKFILAILFTVFSCLPAYTQITRTIGADRVEGIVTQKNEIKNAFGEVNTVGYEVYDDGASASPVDGTGGATITSTIGVSATTPLEGAKSFIFTKGAANYQGEGFSYAFSIDSKDQAKMIRGSFDYAIASGTYADDEMQMWIYDVTNAALIPVTPFKIKNHSLTSDTHSFEFQAAYNSTSYRLIWHIAGTSASAYTLKIDNVQVGPQVARGYGQDYRVTVQTFTSGSGTYTTPAGVNKIKVKMVGGGGGGASSGTASYASGGTGGNTTFGTSLLTANGGTGGGVDSSVGGAGGSGTIASGPVGFTVAGGQGGPAGAPGTTGVGGDGGGSFLGGAGSGSHNTSTAGSATVNSGSGGGGAGSATVGALLGSGGGAGAYVEATISSPSSSYSYAVGAAGAGGTAGTNGAAGGSGAAGRIVVEEYYGSQIISTDAAQGDIVAKANTSTTSIPYNSETEVIFSSESTDTGDNYSPSTGRFTAKVPGYYRVSAAVHWSNLTTTTGNPFFAAIYKNGSQVTPNGNFVPRIAAEAGPTVSDVVFLNAGDYVSIYAYQADSSPNARALSGTTRNYFTVSLEQKQSQILASADVSARYYLSAADTLTRNTYTLINFSNKSWDSHGAVTTGASWKFTAPISGEYEITAILNQGNITPTNYSELSLYVGGVANSTLQQLRAAAATPYAKLNGTTRVKLLAGEYVDVRFYFDHGSTNSATVASEGQNNYIAIKKVGNY